MSRLLTILFTCSALLCLQCSPKQPVVNSPSLDIDLSEIQHNYLSLADYRGDTVFIGGSYEGDRLVFKEVRDVVMVFVDCSIKSTHPEDALVFADSVSQLQLWAQELTIEGGGITFWSRLRDSRLYGGHIKNTHTGIRATQDVAHQNVTVENWLIENTSHEGIYLGVSKKTDQAGSGLYILNNTLLNCGWDGIQIGNTRYAMISGNQLRQCGLVGEYGQDYGITVNPGSVAYIFDNDIQETAKPIQVLDARVFFHAPEVR